uniref:Uncharacterized protein n=1 Tax=Siphoviridae sp. ct0Wl9 TaxID=2827763 RepID=A0A8S5T9N2_9CAUD|nr:MAG TPA: hypothetical protein [Siphoviridae sp. ct0Wl9]
MSGDWQVFHVNCFESLKPLSLQHEDETSLNVNVAKAEKSKEDKHMVKS